MTGTLILLKLNSGLTTVRCVATKPPKQSGVMLVEKVLVKLSKYQARRNVQNAKSVTLTTTTYDPLPLSLPWLSYPSTTDSMNCPKCNKAYTYSVEYSWDSPEHYDGISEHFCKPCNIRVGRWSNKILKEGELESRYNVPTRTL